MGGFIFCSCFNRKSRVTVVRVGGAGGPLLPEEPDAPIMKAVVQVSNMPSLIPCEWNVLLRRLYMLVLQSGLYIKRANCSVHIVK